MDKKSFHAGMKAQDVSSLLLFEGEDAYQKQQALNLLRKTLLPPGLEALNEAVFEEPETDALIAACETVPLMAEKRLIVVRDHPALFGKMEADEALLDYLPRVPDTTVLLFYCVQKPDARKRLYTSIKKAGSIIPFAPLKDLELTHFVVNAFHELGKECDERTADYLIFTAGGDSGNLLTEVSKIAAYCGDATSIRASDVQAVAVPSTECTVFSMTDAVVSGQESRAFTLLDHLLRSGGDRVFILAMLLRQYRLLQHIKIMQYEKKSSDFIRAALGVPGYAAAQYTRQADAYNGKQIKAAVQLCLNAETDIKTGVLNAEGTLEAVMLKLLCLRKTEAAGG